MGLQYRRLTWPYVFVCAFFNIVAGHPASAQFACTTTATETTCTNSGTAPAPFANIEAVKSTTTTNSGTVNGFVESISGAGNATTTNSGTAASFVESVANTGDATATNSGTASGFVESVTSTGNATATNSGTLNGFVLSITSTGNATATNSGTASSFVEALTTTGNATTTNSGTLTGFIMSLTNTGNATATNSGTASSFVQAIATTGNASATNSGTLSGFVLSNTTTGNATAINSGTASSFVEAVTTTGNATAINSGTASSFVEAVTTTGNASATNSGTLSGFVLSVSTTGNATAINSGTASSFVQAITVTGSATVANSGTVNGFVGASSTVSETIVNSGTISNFGGPAVLFGGTGPDTLVLLAGSRIIGSINLIGTNDSVNFLSGNHNLTFNTLAGASVTGAIPFAVLGNQAAAVDPTPFAMTDRVLMDFSRSVSSAIPVMDEPAASAGVPLAFAGNDGSANARIAETFSDIPALAAYASDAAIFKNPTAQYGNGTTVWARGFAGQRIQPASDSLFRTVNQFYGGMIGGDVLARPDLRVGAFVGAGQTRSTVDLDAENTRNNLAFGGAYAHTMWGASFLRVMVQGGGSRTATTRNVNNNLLPGGLETAKADYSGWYVSPEATYGLHYRLGSWGGASYMLSPSLQLRYLYASFGGYTESGTTAPLTVGRRAVQDLEERGQVKLTRTQVFAPTEALMTNIYGGVQGVQRVGSTTVDAVLLGQAIPFATPGKDNVWGGFGGAGLEWRTGRVTLFASAEYLALSDSSSVVSGQGGIRIGF